MGKTTNIQIHTEGTVSIKVARLQLLMNPLATRRGHIYAKVEPRQEILSRTDVLVALLI